MSRESGERQKLETLERLTKKRVEELLSARFEDGFKELKDLPDPFELHDMKRAVERIAGAIERGERIAVVGDYDVDGVISTVIMAEFFELIEHPVETVIPNRFRDGYGVSAAILERVEADVVITVDNGITAFEAAEVCKSRGVDLIITDHHTVAEELPEAYAIVNPKKRECSFTYPDICGAQVAWFLVGALKRELGLDIKMSRFLDLLAVAVVADVMPLTAINRPIVKRGLQMLSSSRRPAFEAVRAYLGKKSFGAMDIGFLVAPRINSAGRMDDASHALKFLRSKSLSEASSGWLKLEELNRQRRATEAEATEEAMEMADPDDSVIVVAKEGWHEGVVGIVASRLVDRFKKPAIVLSVENGRAKGSGRSVGDVDLFSLLKSCEDELLGFGGHKMAAGLSLPIENIDSFRAKISESARSLDPQLFVPKENLLGVLPLEEIDWELMELLERFEPYGEANIRPRFFLEDASVLEAKRIGAEGNHLKILLSDGRNSLQALWFGYEKIVVPGDRISITGSLSINEFNSKRSIQFLVDKIIFK
ncbi:MAG: single-stranded-DNA-specific exonuclease RecJ [Hydrogenimonas sp.]|nr:single-stranded-DNA-specific exonuclease RecJ [Hydrogenimonas sp.]